MPLYEHVFLARQDLAQAQVDALAETATNIIKEHGGNVVKAETWGLRGLAYRIAKNRKAHYVMLDLDAPAAAVAEQADVEVATHGEVGVIPAMTRAITFTRHRRGKVDSDASSSLERVPGRTVP